MVEQPQEKFYFVESKSRSEVTNPFTNKTTETTEWKLHEINPKDVAELKELDKTIAYFYRNNMEDSPACKRAVDDFNKLLGKEYTLRIAGPKEKENPLSKSMPQSYNYGIGIFTSKDLASIQKTGFQVIEMTAVGSVEEQKKKQTH